MAVRACTHEKCQEVLVQYRLEQQENQTLQQENGFLRQENERLKQGRDTAVGRFEELPDRTTPLLTLEQQYQLASRVCINNSSLSRDELLDKLGYLLCELENAKARLKRFQEALSTYREPRVKDTVQLVLRALKMMPQSDAKG